MSKLSLSRTRGQPSGPLTSTQVPRGRDPPVEGLSREELLFQRQLEAALQKSRFIFYLPRIILILAFILSYRFLLIRVDKLINGTGVL
jgi:hypothetical protein